jgi:hypothetical protein
VLHLILSEKISTASTVAEDIKSLSCTLIQRGWISLGNQGESAEFSLVQSLLLLVQIPIESRRNEDDEKEESDWPRKAITDTERP